MKRTLIEKYQSGMIADNELMVECLNMVDPKHPELVLSNLPENILLRLLRFTKECRQGRLVGNYGVVPTQDQILASQNWIEKTFQKKPNVVA